MINKVTKNTFKEEVLLSDKLVLVDFYTTWCAPCKALAPVLVELAEKYDGKIKIVKADIDEEDALAVKAGITSIPTVMFFKNGNAVTSFVGYRSATDIEKIIDRLIRI